MLGSVLSVSYPHGHYHPEEYRALSPPLSVPSLPVPHGGTPRQETMSEKSRPSAPGHRPLAAHQDDHSSKLPFYRRSGWDPLHTKWATERAAS